MKTISWLVTLLLIAYVTACSTGSVSSTEPNLTHTPQASPTVKTTPTRTPMPTPTPIVVEGVGRVIATIKLSNQGGLFPAFGAGTVWVPGPGLLTRIDPRTRQVVAEIPVDNGNQGDPPYAVAAEGDVIWATERVGIAAVRIDPQTNEIVDRIPLEGVLHAMALDGDALWVADILDSTVLRVDTQTKQIVARIPVVSPVSITVGAGSIWVVEHDKGNLVRIDPGTNSILATILLGEGGMYPGQVTFGEGGLWVGDLNSGMVLRVDPDTNEVVARINAVDTGTPVLSVKVGAGAVWAVTGQELNPGQCRKSSVVRIDPQTNTPVGHISVRCAGDIAVSPDGLWVTSFAYKEITLIQPDE